MGSVLDAGGHRGGVGGPLGQQGGRERLRDGALPRPRRAVEQVGVAGPSGGRQGGSEDGRGVRVVFGSGEHHR